MARSRPGTLAGKSRRQKSMLTSRARDPDAASGSRTSARECAGLSEVLAAPGAVDRSPRLGHGTAQCTRRSTVLGKSGDAHEAVRPAYSTTPCGPLAGCCENCCWAVPARRRTSSSIDAEGLLVPLDRHAQGRQEPLGRVEVHHDPLVRLDVLPAGRERLGIEAEVEDHFFGSGRDPAEVRVGRQRPRVVDDDLGLLLLGLGLVSPPRVLSLMSFSVSGPPGRVRPGRRRKSKCTRTRSPRARRTTPARRHRRVDPNAGRRSSRLCRDCRFDEPVELGERPVGARRSGPGRRPGPPRPAPRPSRDRPGRRSAPRSAPAASATCRAPPRAEQLLDGLAEVLGVRTEQDRRAEGGRLHHVLAAPARAAGCRRRTPRRPGPRPPTARRSCRPGSPAAARPTRAGGARLAPPERPARPAARARPRPARTARRGGARAPAGAADGARRAAR